MELDRTKGHVKSSENSKTIDMKQITKNNIYIIIQSLASILEDISENNVSIGSIQIASEFQGKYYSKMAEILQQKNKNQNEEKKSSQIKIDEDQEKKKVNKQNRRIIQNGSEKKKEKIHICKDRIYKNNSLLDDIILQQQYIQYLQQQQLIAQQNMVQNGLEFQSQFNSQKELRQNHSNESLEKKSENNLHSFQSEGTKSNQNKIETSTIDNIQKNQSSILPLECQKQFYNGYNGKQSQLEEEGEQEEEKEEQKHDYNSYRNQKFDQKSYLNQGNTNNHFQVQQYKNESNYIQGQSYFNEGLQQYGFPQDQQNQQQQISRYQATDDLDYKNQQHQFTNQNYQQNNQLNPGSILLSNYNLENNKQFINDFKNDKQNLILSTQSQYQVGNWQNINNNQSQQEQLIILEAQNQNQQQLFESTQQSYDEEMYKAKIKSYVVDSHIQDNGEEISNSTQQQEQQQVSYWENNSNQNQLNYNLYHDKQKQNLNSSITSEKQSDEINKNGLNQIDQVEKSSFISAQNDVNRENFGNGFVNQYANQRELLVQNQNQQQYQIQTNVIGIYQQIISLVTVDQILESEQNTRISYDKSQVDGDQSIQLNYSEQNQEENNIQSSQQQILNQQMQNVQDVSSLAGQNISEQESSLYDLRSTINTCANTQNNNPFGFTENKKDSFDQNESSQQQQSQNNNQQINNIINFQSQIDNTDKRGELILDQNNMNSIVKLTSLDSKKSSSSGNFEQPSELSFDKFQSKVNSSLNQTNIFESSKTSKNIFNSNSNNNQNQINTNNQENLHNNQLKTNINCQFDQYNQILSNSILENLNSQMIAQKQVQKLNNQDLDAIQENNFQNQFLEDSEILTDDESSQIFKSYIQQEYYPIQNLNDTILEFIQNNQNIKVKNLKLFQKNSNSDIWYYTGPQYLIYLIRFERLIIEYLKSNDIKVGSENDLDQISFTVLQKEKLQIVNYLFSAIESKLNVFNQIIPEEKQKNICAMINHIPFRSALNDNNVQIFYNKDNMTLSWFSFLKSEEELKNDAIRYESKFIFKRVFIQNFFSSNDINDQFMTIEQKLHLNNISFNMHEIIESIIDEIKSNYSDLSFSQKRFQVSDQIKFYSSFITFQFELRFSDKYKEFIKQIKEKLSHKIEFVTQDKSSSKIEAYLIDKSDFKHQFMEDKYQDKYIRFFDLFKNYNMLPENQKLAKHLNNITKANNGIFIIDGSKKEYFKNFF
ncbi:hypothetical protein TTHERM_00398060 (macronuclear) [Tetrahymena thermophila SB210]|uniref:Uncharacterized protein n=1 Tax=Tetrahymena thermophila (strain SB210) TaxID=312017 RepID=I7MII8_TETTS|nr:hypothetical protein TTHERM_00398060 [Tetrahymena thermophila SB210]EAR93736.2 hypothetical protein TTHERM_00398060 [Tetrahymena thermophila SB210]|eukprot:XP_001013981.2 hypothetical protein TTHERM_00398060 [Tetrahymena thermophila SB210]